MSEHGEPHTPKEIAEDRIARTVRDGWLCITELCTAYTDPIAAPSVVDHEDDLWSMKNKLDFLLTAIDATRLKRAG
ncbi:MAG: hypothetical protein V4602_15085 [Pseudomonadota bacterium]